MAQPENTQFSKKFLPTSSYTYPCGYCQATLKKCGIRSTLVASEGSWHEEPVPPPVHFAAPQLVLPTGTWPMPCGLSG